MQAYASGDFASASAMSGEKAESRGGTGDGLMWLLEAAKSNFAAGNYKASLAYFEMAEKRVAEFEARPTISMRDMADESASAATNPNAIPYKGSYVDRELLNAYKALCYFAMGKPEDACVEIRRMHERQKKALEGHEAEQKAANDLAQSRNMNVDNMAASPDLAKSNQAMLAHCYQSYANRTNPFCSYLSAIGYLWQGDLGEAVVDLRNISNMDPSNEQVKRDYATVLRQKGESLPESLAGTRPSPYPLTNNVVFLIVESGMCPSRRGVTVHMAMPPPVGYTGFAFPVLDFTPPPFSRVDWSDNYGNFGSTMRVSDMDAVVSYEFKDAMKVLLVRELVSVLVKEGATATGYAVAKNNTNHQDGEAIGWMIVMFSSLWKYTFNTADTRSWQTLPKEFLITNFPTPRDGVVRLGADGGPVKTVFQIDPNKKMTVIYVQSPGNGVFSTKVFQFD